MNVKKFTASTASDALKKVKESLGKDAIILSNRTVNQGGKSAVEIMALSSKDANMLSQEKPTPSEHREPLGQAVSRAPFKAWQSLENSNSDFDEDDGGDYRVSLSKNRAFQQPAMSSARPEKIPDLAARIKAAQASSSKPKVGIPMGRQTLGDMLEQRGGNEVAQLLARAHQSQNPTSLKRSDPNQPQKVYRHELPVAEKIETRPEFMVDRVEPIPQKSAAPVVSHAVMDEIRALRKMVEQNLAGMAWGETVKAEPVKTEVLRSLLDAGFSPKFTRELVEELPPALELAEALTWARSMADRNLKILTQDFDIVDRGGFYALIGPTGVGKTTTTAKLAARCVLKHGPNKVALVTTDSYRIGAFEQLRIYGRILGVSVFMAKDTEELKQILVDLKYKHMVLVDTMGLSQKDKMVVDLNKMLEECRVQRLLVMAATSRGDTLDEIVTAYRGEASSLAGCVLTKVDEAASLAGPIDTMIRHEMKLHYVSNGQRVPEDIHLPNKSYLLHRAFKQLSDTDAHHYDDMETTLMMVNESVAAGGKRG
jgi:flagellar biosynthesis protein FlhF